MDRPVEQASGAPDASSPKLPAAHLMCGTPFWGIAAAVACGYFAYSGYTQLRDDDFYWQHGWWTVMTWAVWVVLLAGLASETRCWRERLFLGLLLANFALGFVLAAWNGAPSSTVRVGREISLALWILAALASLRTVRGLTLAAPKDVSS